MIISGTCVKQQIVSSCKHKHLKYQNKSHLQTIGISHKCHGESETYIQSMS